MVTADKDSNTNCGEPMPPAIDIMDDSFVVASPTVLAARFADRRLWETWWPGLELTVARDRGRKGIRWTVRGHLVGTAEIWLEPWGDGVIVHWYLRADPVGRVADRADRVQRRYLLDYKRRIHRLKDELERGRPAGAPRVDTGR
jgi:hypothetical protein